MSGNKVITTSGGAITIDVKDEQEKIVDLSMASGDQVISPDREKVLSKITVNKPSTLIPNNIKKDVNIGGVVGTLENGTSSKIQPSKSLTITSNGTMSITPDAGYDGLSSVDVTVNVSGGYNLKKVTYKGSANTMLIDITITHNCGSIPKFVIVTSNNSNSTYLVAGSGANESQNSSFLMVVNNVQATASVTSTTFTYNDVGSIRYYRGIIYTYYFFY